MRHPTAAPDPFLVDLARQLGGSGLKLIEHCLRFKLDEGPDLLALIASNGRHGYRATLDLANQLVDGRLSPAAAHHQLRPVKLSELAQFVAGRPGPGADHTEAAILSRAAAMIRRNEVFSAGGHRIEAQTSILTGDYAHAERLLESGQLPPDVEWLVRTSLAHPTRRPEHGSYQAWLDAFNDAYRDHDLLPISLQPGEGTAFDRVHVDVPDDAYLPMSTPLVTIIMSTFKPDQSFITALSSLVRQTWRNLEILVVDDCSPPEFTPLLERGAQLDPRIRLITMPKNVGTYVIRNHAIAQAQGEFIAFLDSDDWAHPQRIELQVTPLLEPSQYVASHCGSIRVDDDMGALRVGYRSFRRAAASLMFRREVIVSTLGGFDEVRKGADTEFARRIEVVFPDAMIDLEQPLILTQLTAGSLSRAEFTYGWHHPLRVAYESGWRRWHHELAAGQGSPFYPPGGPRPFVAPHRFLTNRPAPPADCDVLVLSDWRHSVDRQQNGTAQIAALADGGLTTAFVQVVAPRDATLSRPGLRDEIMTLPEQGRSRFAMWEDPIDASLLIVTDPQLLMLRPHPVSVGLRPRAAVIVADHPTRTPQGGLRAYDPAAVERNITALFDVEASWLPANDVIARSLTVDGARGPILAPHRVAVLEPHRRPFTGLRGGPRPVVGTTGVDHRARDRPSFELLDTLLPADGSYDVRLRIRRSTIDAICRRRRIPSRWLVLDETYSSTAFLRQLDVFVGVPMRSWGPEPSWAATHAITNGAVAILDPTYEAHFGDAAVYAAPSDVGQRLKEITSDPVEFTAQQERGYAYIQGLSARSWQARVRDLLASVEKGSP